MWSFLMDDCINVFMIKLTGGMIVCDCVEIMQKWEREFNIFKY